MVQAGGNCGLYPRLLADIFDSVYTFEPDPLNFFCLANNCQKDNIFKFQAALGDKHAMVQVNRLSMGNVGMHKVSENPAARVPQFTIDDLDLSSFDLLMLDIEGYELNALRGGIKSIEKFKPTIVVENNNKSIVDLLSPLGYRETEKSMMDTILTVE